jgi:hypothetical protein
MKYYHLFSWGVASLMIVAMASTGSHGVYYIDEDLQRDALCWIRNHDDFGGLSPRPWIFLILPLAVFYSYAVYVMRRAREMLDPTSAGSKSSGLLKTHFHRLFALDSNTRTIRIYVCYWIFFLFSACIVLISVHTSHLGTQSRDLSASLSNLILLCFGAKGYVNLLVLASILLSRSYKVCANETTENGEDYFHLNRGLKLQLMTFITTGLKKASEEQGEDELSGRPSAAAGGSSSGSKSKLWTIIVKPQAGDGASEDLSTITNQFLTTEEYRERLREVEPVQVEAVVSGERPSLAERASSLSTQRESLTRGSHHFSIGRKGQESETLMDAESFQSKRGNEALLSKRVTQTRPEEGNLLWRWLRLPALASASSLTCSQVDWSLSPREQSRGSLRGISARDLL